MDYGHGKTNINLKTGIRYGVISMHSVLQSWADESEPYYPCDGCLHDPVDDTIDCMEVCEPSLYFYDEDGYLAETCLDSDIMIVKSPYFTCGDFCSPCVPGAIDLNNARPEVHGHKAYCFGHDWFDEGKAPYRVFEVETGKEILP